MRCALLVLVALLKVRALRTEPLQLTGQKNAVEPVLTNDKNEAGLEMQQDWSGFPSTGEQTLRRIISMDDLEDDYEYPDEQLQSIEQLDEAQINRLSNNLIKMLRRPNLFDPPMLFMKNPVGDPNEQFYPPAELDELKSVAKRTRYYRRYPWKRQNSKNYQNADYDPYNTCTLTRKDVFKLLVALHDARQGNKSRIVNFCNRKRPASAVYTNIRFLGRRRK